MLIQTLDRGLMVICVLYSGPGVDVQVCRDVLEEVSGPYMVVRVKDRELAYEAIPCFLKQKENRSFTDFVDCFSRNGELIAVFRYSNEPLLVDKLAGTPYSTMERLEIAKSLFTRIALLDMAPCIQFEALQDCNLLLDDSLTVSFNYNLQKLNLYAAFSDLAVQVRLAQLLRLLFSDELEKEISPELKAFLKKLSKERYRDNLSMYRDFDAVYARMLKMQEQGEPEPNNILFRIWEKLRKLGRFVRPALACLAVTAAFGYLVYTLLFPSISEKSSAIVFRRIGTVEITR